MDKKIQRAFEDVRADEALKDGTAAFLHEKLYARARRTALRRAGFVESEDPGHIGHSQKIGVVLVAVVVLITCVFFALVLKGVL